MPHDPGRPSRSAWTKLLLVLLGMSLGLATVELAIRAYGGDLKARCAYEPADNPAVGFVRKPNRGRLTNSLGFLDAEHSIEKPSGVFRIIVLGDSVTEGYGVAAEEVYVRQLERLLGRLDGRYEVVNFGTRQYSTAQEVARFEETGLRMCPDLVILAYVLNDPSADGSINDFFTLDRAPSMLFAWLSGEVSSRWAPPREPERVPGCRTFDYYSAMHCDADKWSGVVRAFEGLAALSREREFPVLLAVFPVLDNDAASSFEHYRWRALHGQVVDEASRNGFLTLDLLTVYADRRPADLKVSPTDWLHPNAVGHGIAAAALYRKLVDLPLAEPRPCR